MNKHIEIWQKKKDEGVLGTSVLAQNKKFLQAAMRLNEKKINQKAEEIHDSVFSKVDCLQCANCCKSIPPILNETDINRISRHLRVKTATFKDQYVHRDEDGDLVVNQSPCPFLGSDNYCSIYEVRPKACREYPHTNNFEFRKNIKLHAINATYCPGVYHILEELKNLGSGV
jgi:Fe-S-cluster containining protein